MPDVDLRAHRFNGGGICVECGALRRDDGVYPAYCERPPQHYCVNCRWFTESHTCNRPGSGEINLVTGRPFTRIATDASYERYPEQSANNTINRCGRNARYFQQRVETPVEAALAGRVGHRDTEPEDL